MADQKAYPDNWQIGRDYDPNQHLMNLKGRDYLNVQNRLLWFIRDQRALIVAGLAQTTYTVRTELVEMDRKEGWAHFRTYVRDVLGNEATMYGSESAKDFGDFAEKASTKSLGRALLALGYGTAFAPEMDEGERVVDSPVERQQPTPVPAQAQAPTPIRPQAAPKLIQGKPTAQEWGKLWARAHDKGLVETEADFQREVGLACGTTPERAAALIASSASRSDYNRAVERFKGMAAIATMDSEPEHELAGAFGTRGV